ncbi:DUF5057 domain-containing protein [Cohnella endophytica]|nr:DUF5057 domain-containing protein [Cohnella endophytica]
MKTTLRTYITLVLVVTILTSLMVTVRPDQTNAAASDPAMEIRVLEITENGSSDIYSLLKDYSNPKYVITTMKMKKFVALRDEMDGTYDAVYIGKGVYNSTKATNNTHNTSSIENDITNLKFNQIKQFYIDRGLPVIVYSQTTSNGNNSNGALYQNTAGILRTSLLDYVSKNGSNNANVDNKYVPVSTKENVSFIGTDELSDKTKFLTKTKLNTNGMLKPRLVLKSSPTDYNANQSAIYKAGDTLSYTFDVINAPNLAQGNLVANLYLGVDSVLKFGSDQLVVAGQKITSGTGSVVSFRLPKGYSGLHYWKLELVDQTTGLRDVAIGVIRFRDEQTPIKVLQVLPNNGDSSSLLKTNNMKTAYLKTLDYDIAITVTDIGTFNNGGYKNLNGNYDMLIFGFTDSYNSNAPINQEASTAVNSFIKTGQSVMFTHDTIYQGNENWITYFQKATGQSENKTNMGLNAPHTSTTTTKVNEGLLTRFPFNITSTTPTVNTTHDQYFRLNLEDEKLVPWYNITSLPGDSDQRDSDDSWNHYYTYSYGNVTYSGTGHTNTNFPDWEQQLFVNTMYRAFIGSNHAPTLNVVSPIDYDTSTNKNVVLSNNDILINYSATDFDLIDRTLFTSVSYVTKSTGSSTWSSSVTAIPTQEIMSGQFINQSIANPLQNGGDIKFTIAARDKSGAMTSQIVNVKVVKAVSNLDVDRSLSDNVKNGKLEINKDVTLTYTITPKKIAYDPTVTASLLTVNNIRIQETFPANLEIISSNISSTVTNKTLNGSLTSGYTLNGTLPSITYTRSGDFYIANPITFQIVATPKANGNYALTNSNLNLKDFVVGSSTPIDRTLQFASLAFEAVTKHKGMKMDDITIVKDDISKLIVTPTPFDVTNKNYDWVSDNPSVVSVGNDGTIRGLQAGIARVTATVTDESLGTDGRLISATATVNVLEPGINILGLNTVDVGRQIGLDVVPVQLSQGEKILTYAWSLDSNKAQLASSTGGPHNTLTGVSEGTATLTVSVTTNKNRTLTSSPFSVEVVQPVTLTLPNEIHIGAGHTRDLWSSDLVVDPAAMKNNTSKFTWTSSNTSVARFNSFGQVTGQAAGTATVTLTYKRTESATPVTASAQVVVVDISAPAEYTIKNGSELKLLDLTIDPALRLLKVQPTDRASDILSKLTWSAENKGVVTMDSNGKVSAKKPGIENVSVAYKQFPSGPEVASRTIKIKVVNLLFNKDSYPLYLGDTASLKLKDELVVFPSELKDTVRNAVKWSKENGKNFVDIDSSGNVTAKAAGKQEVYAEYTFSDNSKVKLTVIIDVLKVSPPGGGTNPNTGGDRY